MDNETRRTRSDHGFEMAARFEAAITTTASLRPWNICIWDVDSGVTLATYQGESSRGRTLAIIGNDYVISAQKDKPLLLVWSLGRREQLQMKMVCPGQVSALAVCPMGSYCVAGIEEKLHVWQIASGNLLAIATRHFQNISCLKFTTDGSHFVSAGEDGLVLVWSIARLLSVNSSITLTGTKEVEPLYVWSHHSLPVTDLHVGLGGFRARVTTCSLDQTCKLYDLVSGQLITSIIMDAALTSVTMDPAEYHIFVGTSLGHICQINLFELPSISGAEGNRQQDPKITFSGHTKKVTCLSVSMDGTLLLSGSDDNSVRVWDIASQHCIRTVTHKGGITNSTFIRLPHSLTSDTVKPLIPLQPFKRYLYTDSLPPEGSTKKSINIELHNQFSMGKHADESEDTFTMVLESVAQDEARVNTEKLQQQIRDLLQINQQVYSYAVGEILNSVI